MNGILVILLVGFTAIGNPQTNCPNFSGPVNFQANAIIGIVGIYLASKFVTFGGKAEF